MFNRVKAFILVTHYNELNKTVYDTLSAKNRISTADWRLLLSKVSNLIFLMFCFNQEGTWTSAHRNRKNIKERYPYFELEI